MPTMASGGTFRNIFLLLAVYYSVLSWRNSFIQGHPSHRILRQRITKGSFKIIIKGLPKDPWNEAGLVSREVRPAWWWLDWNHCTWSLTYEPESSDLQCLTVHLKMYPLPAWCLHWGLHCIAEDFIEEKPTWGEAAPPTHIRPISTSISPLHPHFRPSFSSPGVKCSPAPLLCKVSQLLRNHYPPFPSTFLRFQQFRISPSLDLASWCNQEASKDLITVRLSAYTITTDK